MAGFVLPKKNEWDKYAKYRAAIDSGDVNECARLLRVGLKAEFLKHMLARDLVALATMQNRFNIVDLLVSHGADFETHYDFRSPLDHACEKGFLEIATLLLSKGAKTEKIDMICGVNMSALSYASQNGHVPIVELLLSKGVAIVGDVTNPLVISCMHGHTKIVELLLASGRVDPNLVVNKMSVLTIAVSKMYTDIVKLLLVHGATIDKTSLSLAKHSGKTSSSGRGLFDVLNKWPVTMLIIIFEKIGLYNQLDLLLLEDFQSFIDYDDDKARLLALVMHFLQ